MSLISNNLKYLRRINGLTQESFAQRIGTKRANVGAYEEARAVPPVDILKIIANTFGISVDDFVKKDIRKLKETPDLTFNFDPKSVNFTSDSKRESNIFTEDFDITPSIGDLMNKYLPTKEDFEIEKPNILPKQATIKPFEKRDFQDETYSQPPSFKPNYQPSTENYTKNIGNIQLVKRFQFNDYLTKFSDNSFLKSLQTFALPNLPENNYRAFEIGEDFSFEGALLIGLPIKNLYELADGKNYVLVTKSQGIIYRRVYNRTNDKGTFLLSADNHRFPSIEVSLKDVIEAWDIKAFVSQILPEPTKSFEKLHNLVEEMKFELERLKK